MTDTTHEAPERIWAGNWLADLGQGSWDIGEWRNCDWPSEGYKTVKYVRADLVQAAVAAALREAAKIPDQWIGCEPITSGILALITPDAQAALDRVVAAERERCADLERRLKLWEPQNTWSLDAGRWPIREGRE